MNMTHNCVLLRSPTYRK